MERITQRLRHDQIRAIDAAISDGEFDSRSDAIRTAIDVLFDLTPDADDDTVDRRPRRRVGALRRLSADALTGRHLEATYVRGGVELEAAGEIVAIRESEKDRRTLVLDDGSRVAPADVADYDLSTREVADV